MGLKLVHSGWKTFQLFHFLFGIMPWNHPLFLFSLLWPLYAQPVSACLFEWFCWFISGFVFFIFEHSGISFWGRISFAFFSFNDKLPVTDLQVFARAYCCLCCFVLTLLHVFPTMLIVCTIWCWQGFKSIRKVLFTVIWNSFCDRKVGLMVSFWHFHFFSISGRVLLLLDPIPDPL